MPIALSIAGSDPTGGAGLQADVQVFRALGVHGAAIPTVLTVQDTVKIHRSLPVFPNVVLEQIRALGRDLPVDAIKLGALATDDVARMVELGLEEFRSPHGKSPPLIIDPVLAASDGSPLLERRAIPTLIRLFERATLVTPNLPEAERLTECDVSTARGVEAAARIMIADLGAPAVLVTGGHGSGAVRDLLAVRASPPVEGAVEFTWLEAERIDVGAVHGTGCALAAAVCAEIAWGRSLTDAVNRGRRFVAHAIRASEARGSGARLLGLD